MTEIPKRINSDHPDIVRDDFMNITGRVIVLGDLHGSPVFLKQVMDSLAPDDRVVLVGDLIDRGSESFNIVKTLIGNPRVVAIRGNHEDDFLKFLAVRKILSPKANEILTTFNDTLKKNPFKFELLLKLLYRNLNALKEIDSNNLKEFATFIQNGGLWALSHSIEALTELETYIDALPYLRIVKTPKGEFLTAHADASFLSDDDLTTLTELNDSQKLRMTWAREHGEDKAFKINVEENKRSQTQRRTYVGHNIVISENVSVFRNESNHCNLDFGAYSTRTLVGVEHPEKVVVFGSPPKEVQSQFYEALSKLGSHYNEIEFDSIEGLKQYQRFCQNKGFIDTKADVKLSQEQLPHLSFSGVKLSQKLFDRLSELNAPNIFDGATLTDITIKKPYPVLTGARLTQKQFEAFYELNECELFRGTNLSYVKLTQEQFETLYELNEFELFRDTNLSDVKLTQEHFDNLLKLNDPNIFSGVILTDITIKKPYPALTGARLTQKQFEAFYKLDFGLFKNTNLELVHMTADQYNVLRNINGIKFSGLMSAPLLNPEDRNDLYEKSKATVSKENSLHPNPAILAAMTKAIAECGNKGKLGQEKKRTLEEIKLKYSEPMMENRYGNALIKSFVATAATPRNFWSSFGDTASINAFSEELLKNKNNEKDEKVRLAGEIVVRKALDVTNPRYPGELRYLIGRIKPRATFQQADVDRNAQKKQGLSSNVTKQTQMKGMVNALRNEEAKTDPEEKPGPALT